MMSDATTTHADAPLIEAEAELAKAGTDRHAATGAAIETWFIDHFNNIPLGWDTAMRNHVRSAADDLKTRLAAL
jgi:hypothetical protein